ncbi:MAG TPA: SPOR domain-containing protein [Verrucomicrobiae bacterium]|nr:SPOR domain-containing protein [Verrucomicrobiae bacterium]
MARLEELAEAEKSKQQKAANKPQSSKPPFKMPSIPQSFWTNLSAFALSVGKFLLKAAIVLFTSLWKVVKLVDFRRPAIRRAFFGVVGAALLISVFAGIHVLNVNRERAMKNPGKTVTKQAAKPAKASRAERARGEEERSSAQETPAPAAAPAVENAAQAEPNAPKAEAETGKRYVVQVATYATAQDAERVVQDIKDSGAPAFVKALSSRSGRVYHSVFLGRFSDADEAQTYLEKFRKGNASKSFQDAFVRTLD